jgi:hypothetical protein
MGPVGFWLDKDGNVAATDPQGKPQVTPGMRDNPEGATYYDAGKDLNYNVVNGTKVYQSPVSQDASGNTIFKKSIKGAPISDTGGGALHGRPTWNPKTGTWDVGLDPSKILSWAAAAGISAGVINAAMAGGAAAAAAGGSSGPVLEGVAAGAGGASTAVPAGSAALGTSTAAGGSSLVGNILKYGVPTAGNLVGGIIQAKASSSASDAQQKYLEEALAYQKEQDAYNRARQSTLDQQNISRYDFGKKQEGDRYATYSGNIAPYLATGSSANSKMASLLGLPAGAPLSAGPAPNAAPVSPAAAGMTITSQPMPRTVAPPMGAPTPSSALVTMQAPDGTTKQVPASQVDFYKSKGATVTGAAA